MNIAQIEDNLQQLKKGFQERILYLWFYSNSTSKRLKKKKAKALFLKSMLHPKRKRN